LSKRDSQYSTKKRSANDEGPQKLFQSRRIGLPKTRREKAHHAKKTTVRGNDLQKKKRDSASRKQDHQPLWLWKRSSLASNNRRKRLARARGVFFPREKGGGVG